MLENSKAYSGFAVDDIGKARDFYGETLGLKTSVLEDGNLLQIDLAVTGRPSSTSSRISRPRPTRSSTSRSTTWTPRSTTSAAKGVTFERYEGFDQDDKGIDRSGPADGIAWFKDPAGNILAVHGEM